MISTTTDLDIIRDEPRRFTWGEVITTYEIGPYQIVEYYQWKQRGCEVLSGRPDYDQRRYHGYINGKSTSRGWDSLDAALAGLIAYRREGGNSQAATYFMRMLPAIFQEGGDQICPECGMRHAPHANTLCSS